MAHDDDTDELKPNTVLLRLKYGFQAHVKTYDKDLRREAEWKRQHEERDDEHEDKIRKLEDWQLELKTWLKSMMKWLALLAGALGAIASLVEHLFLK